MNGATHWRSKKVSQPTAFSRILPQDRGAQPPAEDVLCNFPRVEHVSTILAVDGSS